MKLISISFVVFLILIGIGAAQLIHYGPHLPDRVVSHYAPDGRPNGWSTKASFIGTYIAVLPLTGAFFTALAFFIQRVPPYFIHIPRREWWMTKERHQEARNILIRQLFWFGGATVAFFIVAMNLAMRVTLGESEGIRVSFSVALAGYLLVTVLWIVSLYQRFGRSDREGRS